jgi:cell division protease FtsH
VAGIDEAKQELTEIVDFLKNSKKYTDVGAKIPRGCLLIGSPGTGKTLLARAIAGEAGVPFFSISGSDFVEMFVGVGASRVRDMIEQAKKSAPCIVFIDEIDAVGRHRGSGVGGGNDEREQTLNQMLVEMDGFSENEGVVIIAATNRPDVLDRALLRPGRFDRQITVPNPDILGLEQILAVHLKKVQMASDVDAKVIARGTPGFAGADLANLVNEGALIAARGNQKMVTMKNLEDAKDKIMMGSERKSMIMQKSEKELTAYHESGHAITALNCENSDPIHKATIIPRGRALGLVMRLPETDRFSITRAKLHDDLVVAMGGRAAEELIFGYDKVTTGAMSDIEQATNMARSMVVKWGLSDKVGTVDFSEDESMKPYGSSKAYSEETGKLIDSEIKRIVDEAFQRAKKILNEKKHDLEKLAKCLLEYETLSGDEIKDLLAGKEIRKNSANYNKDGEQKQNSASHFIPNVSEA